MKRMILMLAIAVTVAGCAKKETTTTATTTTQAPALPSDVASVGSVATDSVAAGAPPAAERAGALAPTQTEATAQVNGDKIAATGEFV